MAEQFFRRDDIQALRAISVISVICFHAGVPGFSGGFLGVDIFFAISGYLMAQVIYRDHVEHSFRFRDFYMRRARRILPALYLTLMMCTALSWFIQFPSEFEDFTDALAGSVLFLANAVLMNQSSGYFATTLENHPLLHMWSLSVEEQFYLLFPLCFVGLLGVSSRFRIPILICVAAGSVALAEWYYATSPSATFFHLPARLFEFIIGVLAFEFRSRVSNIPERVIAPLHVFGLTLVVGSIVFMTKATPLPSTLSLVPLMGVFCILVVPQSSKDSILVNPGLIFVGGISFSLYLLHQPVFAFARLSDFDSPWILSGLILLLLPLATIMKQFIEDPFRDPKRVSTRFFLGSVGLVTAGILALSSYSKEADGLPERFSGPVRSAVETAVGSPVREKCSTDGEDYVPPEKGCWFRPDQPSWVVFGDSHSNELAYALQDHLKDSGQGVWQLTFSGCSTAFGQNQQDPCNAWTNDVLDALEKNREKIKGVIVSMRLQSSLHGRHEKIYPEIPNLVDEVITAERWDKFVHLLQSFDSRVDRVVWVRQAPELDTSMRDKLRQLNHPNKDSVQGVPRSWWEKRREWSTARVSEAEHFAVVIDPADFFCSSDYCLAIKAGESLYRDMDHMSLSGAKRAIEGLLWQ